MTREPEGQLRGVDEKMQPPSNLHPQTPKGSTRRLCNFHHLLVLQVPASKPSLGARDQVKMIKILLIWRQPLGWGPRFVGRR